MYHFFRPAHTELSDEDRRKLMAALSDTPFERYRHRAFHHDSPEHVQSALKADREDKFKRLEISLASDLANRRRRQRRRTETAGEKEKVQGAKTIVVHIPMILLWVFFFCCCGCSCIWTRGVFLDLELLSVLLLLLL